MTGTKNSGRPRLVGLLTTGGSKAFLSIVFSGIGVQLLTLASGPIVARMLGPDGRGQMIMVTIFALWTSIVAINGLPAAISHTVAAAGAPARDVVRGMTGRWLLRSVLPAVVAATITGVYFRHSPDVIGLAVVGAVLSFSLSSSFLLAAMLQGEGSVRLVNVQRLLGTASYVVIVVFYWLVFPDAKVWLVLMAYAGSLLLGGVLCWVMLQAPIRDPAVRADRNVLTSFARQAFLSGLRPMDSFGIDQALIGVILGNAALGLYTVAYSITSVTNIALMGVATILLPRMTALPRSAATILMRRWIAASIGIAALLVIGLELILGPAVRILFGADFVEATPVARVLAIAWALFALRRVLTAAAQAQGRVTVTSVAEAVSTVVLVAGVVVGTHLGGIVGAAWALVAAGAMCCVWIASALTWRHHPDADEVDDTDTRPDEADALLEIEEPETPFT